VTAGAERDRALVAAVLARGDERAFGELYDRHTPYLYRLALRLAGGDAQMAEDVVHDAWVGATQRLAAFEWRSQFRTWVAGFVVHRTREAQRPVAPALPLDAFPLPADDGVLAGTFDRVDLERAVARLAPGFRQVLVLHDVEGYTHEEIGTLLGIEPGTSKSQLSRARAALRRSLGPPSDREAP
jgi:RNA polymerase sigma-70 factor (ECF subfamily)